MENRLVDALQPSEFFFNLTKLFSMYDEREEEYLCFELKFELSIFPGKKIKKHWNLSVTIFSFDSYTQTLSFKSKSSWRKLGCSEIIFRLRCVQELTEIKSPKELLTPTWFEHAAFWSGVRRATIAPRSQVCLYALRLSDLNCRVVQGCQRWGENYSTWKMNENLKLQKVSEKRKYNIFRQNWGHHFWMKKPLCSSWKEFSNN